jgi:hypothetical protein
MANKKLSVNNFSLTSLEVLELTGTIKTAPNQPAEKAASQTEPNSINNNNNLAM